MIDYKDYQSNGNMLRDVAFLKLKEFMNETGFDEWFYSEEESKEGSRVTGTFYGNGSGDMSGNDSRTAVIAWRDD